MSELMTPGWTRAVRAAADAVRSAGPVPRELPADVAGFTGRTAELAALDRLLLGDANRGTAAIISAVSGTAGVGKTALSVHWAHHAAVRFPDGQLHVDLRGYDPGARVTPADALASMLRSLGVRGLDIPADETERAARYRSLLAGQQMLIVLDNAASAEQVRPLLPGHPSCRVLVTSRDSLAGLVARDGARRLQLDLLPRRDAVALLTGLIGERAGRDPKATGELAGQCCGLPLALRVAAELAASRPATPLAGLVADLADEQQRLDLLDAVDDPRTAVRAVFSWSYRHLSPEAARLFRLLGLHPGPDITVPAAASLAAVPVADAQQILAGLARGHLITEHVPGRYAFHDLLRAYAAEQARGRESRDDLDAATGRLLDHHLHAAAAATMQLDQGIEPVSLCAALPGTAAVQPASAELALAWLEEERMVLLACVTLAADTGHDRHAWQLPWALTTFLQIRGYWQDWVTAGRTALAAATRTGDPAAQALAGRLLARACNQLGEHDLARQHFARSLRLYQQLGDRPGETKVLQNLGFVELGQGRYTDALGYVEQSLRLARAVGDKAAEATALNNISSCHSQLGDYEQALAYGRSALRLAGETGYRKLEGHAWDSIGYAALKLGNLAEAVDCFQRALGIVTQGGSRVTEAGTLTHLGDARQAAGDLAGACAEWQRAADIYAELRHPGAEEVRARLEALPAGAPVT